MVHQIVCGSGTVRGPALDAHGAYRGEPAWFQPSESSQGCGLDTTKCDSPVCALTGGYDGTCE